MKLISNMNDFRSRNSLAIEVVIRCMLITVFLMTEYAEPFRRKIQPEELWLYKNPRTASYVPTYMLWILIVIIPLSIIFLSNMVIRSKTDGIPAILGLTLSFGINGVITNITKLIVGRPRPDFYYRCFPSGEGDISEPCNGDKSEIIEGLKSFPSGHSSFIFAGMMYSTLYLCGKLQPFTSKGRGESWRLLLCLLPIFFAIIVALSRTCDYHHHWQDVLVGSFLGIFISWISYFQYYPSFHDTNCDKPLCVLAIELGDHIKRTGSEEDITVKWI